MVLMVPVNAVIAMKTKTYQVRYQSLSKKSLIFNATLYWTESENTTG